MKKKIVSIILIIMIVFNISYVCKATLVEEENIKILTKWTGDTHYSYNGEEKNIVLRKYGEDPVYSTKKNNIHGLFVATDIKICNNQAIKNVIKNGYGCKTYEELGCSNWIEAELATQEAICITAEGRNIEDYVIDDAYGTSILGITRKILENAEKEPEETIEIKEKSNSWREYPQDKNYKYKEYSIISKDIDNINVSIEIGQDSKITDIFGNTKNIFSSDETFYLIVPKDIEQEIKIKTYYEKEGVNVYTCKNSEEADNTYILIEKGMETIENTTNINFYKKSQIEIKNIDHQTKQPIQGNTFSIIDEESSVIKENLITNQDGKIELLLGNGKYYLKQNSSVDGYDVQKSLIEINIENGENIHIKVESTKNTSEETTNVEKETNYVEENKYIQENNITEVSNIANTNIHKEIINQTNETNLNNVNHFINTINRRNIVNLQKNNVFNNNIDEEFTQSKEIQGENETLKLSRQDYINYVDMVLLNSSQVPILPVASR